MEKARFKVIIIDDNSDDRQLISEVLSEVENSRIDIVQADRLLAGLECLSNETVEAILLDLDLPDSHGLDTFIRLHDCFQEIPIIILSSLDNEAQAIASVQEGAQDYLVKNEINGKLLEKSIIYSIGRLKLQLELEQSKQEKRQEKEMEYFEQYAGSAGAGITADSYSPTDLQKNLPKVFDEIVEAYGNILDMSLEKSVFSTKLSVSEKLAEIADRLGFLMVGPRSVMDIHVAALKKKTGGVNCEKSKVYLEESKLLVLELMGDLVLYYRKQL